MAEIIVVYYSNNHFEELTEFFSEDQFKIYDKSNIYKNAQFKNILSIENEGREGATYLKYIIDQYDNLSNYTIFIQDDIDNHIPSNTKFYDITTKVINNNIQFYQYESCWKKNSKIIKRIIRNGQCSLHTFPSKNSIKEACIRLNIFLPEQYLTETCAFFIVNKDVIRKRNKEFYISLREWLLEDIRNEFVLEHMWFLIFNN